MAIGDDWPFSDIGGEGSYRMKSEGSEALMAVEDARYDELGQSLFDLVPKTAERIFLYVEFDDGVLTPSLFYEVHGIVALAFTDQHVSEALFQLQQVFGPTIRAMEFEMAGTNFTTCFTYGNHVLEHDGYAARCDAALTKTFGHAITSYPSL